MLEMRVPANMDMMLVVRMALSGMCVRRGMGLEALDKARMASDEACYYLVESGQADTLKVDCSFSDDGLAVSFTALGGNAEQTAADEQTTTAKENITDEDLLSIELARSVLQTLVKDVDITHDNGRIKSVSMTMLVSSEEE